MAKNANYYAKIAGTWEQQYLKTTSAQTTYTDPGTGFFNGQTTVKGALDKIQSSVGAANGLATLGSDSKITASQLPSYIVGGMKFGGILSFSAPKSVDNVMGVIDTVGQYLIVTATGSFTQGTTYTGTVLAPGDEGDSTFPIDVEAGDWIVITAVDTGNPLLVTFAIVNNTYQNASTTATGITRLSNATTFSTLAGDDVVTEGVLGAVMITNFAGTGGNLGSANTYARSDHAHDYLSLAGGTLTGALSTRQVTVGNGAVSSNLIINPIDEDLGIGSSSNNIRFRYTADGATVESTDLYANNAGSLIWGTSNVITSSNWESFVNEIHLSTSAPTSGDGKNGDIWIEYATA